MTGIDLFQRLVELSAEKGYKVYLFGAKEEVVSRVRAIFEERYPGIQIVGYQAMATSLRPTSRRLWRTWLLWGGHDVCRVQLS